MVTIPPRKNKVPNILGDWDDVRFFLAVAKTGSFSAAATQLNTKQTTVGRRIQALERRLGAKLFDRHRHGMEVTPAARGVLAQAESMMSNATAIERHLAGLDREIKDDDLHELELNLLYLENKGKGMFKFYNIKNLSIHGEQY